MIKKIIFIFLLFLLFKANAGDIIQAGIKYNEATAKVEAFKNVNKKIGKELYKEFLKDKDWKENIYLLENELYEVDNNRYLCPFYFKKTLIIYSVVYDKYPLNVFYYNSLGRLVRFDILNQFDYPRKNYGYSRFGNLTSVIFEVDNEEQFIYDKNGKLTAHWQGSTMTNKDNKLPKFLKIKRGPKD